MLLQAKRFPRPILSFMGFSCPIVVTLDSSPPPSSLVTILIVYAYNRGGKEFSVSLIALVDPPSREKLDFLLEISNTSRITGHKFDSTAITGSDTRRNHAWFLNFPANLVATTKFVSITGFSSRFDSIRRGVSGAGAGERRAGRKDGEKEEEGIWRGSNEKITRGHAC